jgi:hypothetical protein
MKMPSLKPEPIGLVTYPEEGTQRIYAFALGDTGHLYVHYWNGSAWKWADQEHPPQEAFLGQASNGVSAVTYRENNKQRIYAFVAYDNLYVNYWNGSAWKWANQGKPQMADAGGALNGNVSAITYREDGIQRLYVFGQGALDWSHFINYWDGTEWQWSNRGMPPNTQGMLGGPSVVSYQDEAGKRRIYDFASSGPGGGASGRLYVHYWNGSAWKWADQGTPGVEPNSNPSVITYKEGETQRIYAFVSGSPVFDTRLFVNYWNGIKWQWADLGSPPGKRVTSPPQAVTYREGNTQRIYVFVSCEDDHLWICYWDGSKWEWADQGSPPASWFDDTLRAITYRVDDIQRIYAFFVGYDKHLWLHYWNGSKWQWADQGMP